MATKLTDCNNDVPKLWHEAIELTVWKDAMSREKVELEAENARELVKPPPGAKILPGLWRFKLKRDELNAIVRTKARWCVNGATYHTFRKSEEIFSPVTEYTTIRCFFEVAATLGLIVLQADFPNAYLNAEIEEDMFVYQPTGLHDEGKERLVCKLKKVLYGSPISGNKWHRFLQESIESLGCRRSSIDHFLFTRTVGKRVDMLTIYVDDVLVASSEGEAGADRQLNELNELHNITKLKKLHRA